MGTHNSGSPENMEGSIKMKKSDMIVTIQNKESELWLELATYDFDNKPIFDNQIARVTWFKDLEIKAQAKLNRIVSSEWNSTINLPSEYLVHSCPACGRFEQEAQFLNETGYETRCVTYKCNCGQIFDAIH